MAHGQVEIKLSTNIVEFEQHIKRANELMAELDNAFTQVERVDLSRHAEEYRKTDAVLQELLRKQRLYAIGIQNLIEQEKIFSAMQPKKGTDEYKEWQRTVLTLEALQNLHEEITAEIELQNEKLSTQEHSINRIVARAEDRVTNARKLADEEKIVAVQQEQQGLMHKMNLKTIFRTMRYLVGIRTIYLGILKAVNSWFSTTEEGIIQQQRLEAVWSAFGQTLGKIITFLVDGLFTILGYANAIVKALFGFELFTRVASKNLKSASGYAKELRKQLMGFDEANVLQAPNGGGGGGAGGGLLPEIPTPDLSWLEKFRPAIDWFIEVLLFLWDILKEVVGFISEYFIKGLQVIAENFEEMSPGLKLIIAQFAVFLAGLLLFDALSKMSILGWIVIAIVAIITAIGWLNEHWDEVVKFFKDTIDKIKQWFGGLADNFKSNIDKIKQWFENIATTIKTVYTSIASWIKTKITDIYVGIKTSFDNIKKVLSNIINFITGTFKSNWQKAWDGVKKVFENIVNGLKTIFLTPINFIIDVVNGFIREINKVKVPSWMPLIGGKGVNIPLLKPIKLAQGGIITKATTVTAGEHGREAYLNLENHTGWAEEIVDVLKEKGGYAGGEIVNIVQIDGREVARYTRKLNQEEDFRSNRGINYAY